MEEKDKNMIYIQDNESFKYQDKLFWSRFQTLSVIEGASIWAILFNHLDDLPKIILAFANLIIISFLCLLGFKDRLDAKNFTERMGKFEDDTLGTHIVPAKVFGSITGEFILYTICGLIFLFNIYLVLFSFQIWNK